MTEPQPQGGAVSPKPFPEFGLSMDPAKVPWHDAVVWSDRLAQGQRVYEWLTKEHIAKVGWTDGLVSIEVANESFLHENIMYFIVQAPFVAVGQNIRV